MTKIQTARVVVITEAILALSWIAFGPDKKSGSHGVCKRSEKIAVRAISDKDTRAAINPDPNSPLLIIGDSHTLVFHDFLAEKSGLPDQLAYETGFAPDLIGTRGSGATSVRVSLYRRAKKDPEYLAKKKIIVWCFAAREFTESDQGWDKVPVGQ